MKKSSKKLVSFRLSETVRFRLENLARTYNVSQADVVSALIYCFYRGDEDVNGVLDMLENMNTLD